MERILPHKREDEGSIPLLGSWIPLNPSPNLIESDDFFFWRDLFEVTVMYIWALKTKR